jgi:hypothetical protein
MMGPEIPHSKVLAVNAHLEKCPECRREYDAYVKSLEKTKEWLKEDSKDWEDWEWQAALQGVKKENVPKASPLVPWPFKKTWAYSLMAVCAVVLTLLVVRPSFIEEGTGPGERTLAQQEVISMTMVSQETGLKIVWFFNKNFKLEEVEK